MLDIKPLPVVALRDARRLERELTYRYPDATSARARSMVLGVSPSTYKRIVVDGTMAPGNRFIASVLDALPGTRFERWFEVRHPQQAA